MQGVIATLLAGFALAAWISIGSVFVEASGERDGTAVPVSLLIGSALTAVAFAVLTRVGVVDGALWVVGAASVGVLFLRRSITHRMIGEILGEYRQALRGGRVLRVLALPVAALLWLYAIAPPRDGDVMRYHLAHVRQIISDGRWESVADYHYALPFGWTLNYLPFERLGLPQAAGLVNVGLWVLMLGGLLRTTRGLAKPLADRSPGAAGSPPDATGGLAAPAGFSAAICLAFLVHPFVIRTFASAMADAYGAFVVYTIAILLLKMASSPGLSESQAGSELQDSAYNRPWRDAPLMGFVFWIGAQSRYQLVAAGLAATVVFALVAVRARISRALMYFAVGGIAALILSAPFYLANLTAFGNPVWPLFVSSINGTTAYADRIAADYTAALTGPHDPATILFRIGELLASPALFPLSILLVATVLLSLRAREVGSRRLALFGVVFLCIWGAMQPRLYPRNIVLLLSLGPLLLAPVLLHRLPHRLGPLIKKAVVAGIVVMVAASAVFARDYVRYDFTSDSSEFHRFTWYYPVYDWVNRNTPPAARFLVITYSGHSYYLDRPYRRADPWLSGVVDWSRVDSAEKLKSILDSGAYDYVIYDDRDWSEFVGGSAMASSVKSAIARGILTPVHESRERLYTSRITRVFSVSNVFVLKVARESAAPLRSGARLSAPLSAL